MEMIRMKGDNVLMSVVCLVVVVGCMMMSSLVEGDAIADQCANEFPKVTTCLTFATGKQDTPTKECCGSVTELKNKNPVCLCYIIQQIHSGNNAQIKNMGIQEARLLQLPSACKLTNASSAECPKLLHLSPGSPDAAIFTNSSTASTITPPSSSSTASPGAASDSSSSGTSPTSKPSNAAPASKRVTQAATAVAVAVFLFSLHDFQLA